MNIPASVIYKSAPPPITSGDIAKGTTEWKAELIVLLILFKPIYLD